MGYKGVGGFGYAFDDSELTEDQRQALEGERDLPKCFTVDCYGNMLSGNDCGYYAGGNDVKADYEPLKKWLKSIGLEVHDPYLVVRVWYG